MAKLDLTPKKAFILFVFITVVLVAQAVWWITFMAILVDEKVDIAMELGASQEYVDRVHDQEISRQIMVGMEGIFFLVLVGVGAWLIYRALRKTEELKFHQQNFLMAVTHELKTPLASIKIYLDTLRSPKISEEKKMNILPRLKDDANRLEKLVENILEAGRFERSGYQLNMETFNLTELINESLDKLEQYPSQIPLEINRTGLEQSVYIEGDPLAFNRAIDAIIENSLKYHDKQKIKLDIDLYIENSYINLNISDNGIGLNKKDLTLIFNRFYRVGQEMIRERPGTGLGLYLCREIIRAHKGNITASSDGIGKGVKFNIKLKVSAGNENNITG